LRTTIIHQFPSPSSPTRRPSQHGSPLVPPLLSSRLTQCDNARLVTRRLLARPHNGKQPRPRCDASCSSIITNTLNCLFHDTSDGSSCFAGRVTAQWSLVSAPFVSSSHASETECHRRCPLATKRKNEASCISSYPPLLSSLSTASTMSWLEARRSQSLHELTTRPAAASALTPLGGCTASSELQIERRLCDWQTPTSNGGCLP
jgi:hypothetical protein